MKIQTRPETACDVPDDELMAKELAGGILTGYEGVVKYHPLFNT